MQIVVLDGFTLNPGDISWDALKKLGTLTVYDRTPNEKILERINNAEIVFTNKTPLTKQTIQACKNLKYIGVLATGYNVVDIQAAKELKIPVTNVPSYGTQSVAQYTAALLLELCHHIGAHSDSVHNGDWANSKDFCYWNFPLVELEGKTVGIIGFGRIGQMSAKILKAFGMKVLAYSRHPKEELKDLATYVSLDELFAQSDVISLHCPLFAETQNLINKENIAKMKDGVMILNTSRGPVINEKDLADALNSGKVLGAAVDVVSTEPIKNDNPLLTAKNCIITPHIAWAAKEPRERLMQIAVDNLDSFLKEKPINVVNQ